MAEAWFFFSEHDLESRNVRFPHRKHLREGYPSLLRSGISSTLFAPQFSGCLMRLLHSIYEDSGVNSNYGMVLGQSGNLCRGHLLVPQTVCRWEVHDIDVILAG